jgi:outer membrane receptor protein involved in Fe transport
MLLVSVVLGVSAAARAQASTDDPKSEDAAALSREELERLDLEDLLQLRVSTATKTEQTIDEAPAIVTVITRDELQARGLTSVAEALRTVPGFYDVYDLVGHNVGVRGVNGGARASGNVLKLMIDGQSVSFRPSTGNFFGEELIPVDAVERIEVIRGPASAVYGANAFLGVVNVITRTGSSADGARVIGSIGAQRGLSTGIGAVAGFGYESADVLVAGQHQVSDRSGLALPETSPRIERLRSRGLSSTDTSTPRSFFGKLALGSPTAGPGRVGAMASLQSVDAVGEFQNFAPLTHGTRIGILNQTYRAWWNREVGPVTLTLAGAAFDSAPTNTDRISLADPSFALLRNVRAMGLELSGDASWSPLEPLSLSLGFDYLRENHVLQTYRTLLLTEVRGADGAVLRPSGSTLPGDGEGSTRRFDQFGGTAQVLWKTPFGVGLTGGARLERHSVYGTHFSPRLAAVWTPAHLPVGLKLLFGSSFKAPSAEQLYTRPMQSDDLVGNPALKVQNASTGELAGTVRLGTRGELSLNLFVTSISGRVEFTQRGLFLEARNAANEWFAGGELDGRINLHSSLQLRAGASVSRLLQRDRTSAIFVTGSTPDQPLYPAISGHLLADWHLPWVGLRLIPEVSLIGPREASQSNVLERGALYSLPAYVFTAVTLSMPERKLFANRATRFSLRVTNLLGTTITEPGFNGVDVPTVGRTVLLTVVQSL